MFSRSKEGSSEALANSNLGEYADGDPRNAVGILGYAVSRVSFLMAIGGSDTFPRRVANEIGGSWAKFPDDPSERGKAQWESEIINDGGSSRCFC